MRKVVFLAMILLIAAELTAQQLSSIEKKLSIHLRDHPSPHPTTYILAVSDLVKASALVRSRPGMRIIKSFPDYNLLYVQAAGLHRDTTLLHNPAIRFVDVLRIPKEEKAIDGFDPGTNLIAYAHKIFPAINGNGSVVSVKEKLPDSTDIDFRGRIFSIPSGATSMSTHATNMATMIAGGGNSDRTSKGVAWAASITSSDFINLLPDNLQDYIRFNITVQNHSYGTGIENYYGADAAAYDKSVTEKSDLLHVFSSGNSGDQTAPDGTYRNLQGFANLTGSFKMSKNTLTVGAIDSFYQAEALSSRGPAYDGRIKPELVAYGHDGSSGAAAIISGTTLLLQQAYVEKHGSTMPAALAKAILINSADDVGIKGIDFASGYGSVNVAAAVRAITNGNYFSGSITGGATYKQELTVPAAISQLKVTLGYTDLPAPPNADKALVNDLDLVVTELKTGATWRPWVLNSFPHSDSLQLPAIRKKDTLNNIEQVTIELPEPGTYQLTISGNAITGMQPFSIAFDALPEKKSEFTYPTSIHPVFSGSTIVLRWATSLTGGMALLESTVNGSEWKTENAALDITKKFYKWNGPDTSGWVQFRITAGGQSFLSDTIAITGVVRPGTAFHCADSALLFWNRAGVNAYRVYRLGEKYMDAVTITQDTSIIVNNVNGSEFFAIAPLLSSGREGQRSYAFDYAAQGAGCYVNTFLADNINGEGQLIVILATTFTLKALTIEKFSGNAFVPWKSLPPGAVNYHVTDAGLVTGTNLYRLKIELPNQQVIYSGTASLFHFNDKAFILYPNPVKQNSSLTLASKDADDVVFMLYHSTGAFIREIQITDNRQSIPVAALPQGIYFYKILKKNHPSVSGRFIIQ